MELEQITPFMYGKGQPVRTVVEADGEPWFVLADVCEILEIRQAATVIRRLDDDEYRTASVPAGKLGNRDVLVVSEPGVFQVVMRSTRPEAKMLRRFIAHDILPEIRRTGRYITPEAKREVAWLGRFAEGRISDLEKILEERAGNVRGWRGALDALRQNVIAEHFETFAGPEAWKAAGWELRS
jgi:prophage antirepressor-like protein